MADVDTRFKEIENQRDNIEDSLAHLKGMLLEIGHDVLAMNATDLMVHANLAITIYKKKNSH